MTDKKTSAANNNNNRNNNLDNGKRAYNRISINQAFTDFLRIGPSDQDLARKYHHALIQGGEIFAQVFYDYLLASPATAGVLNIYKKNGGSIDSLVKKQLQHLLDLLACRIDDASAQRMAVIGEIHYRHGIEPVWVMGAYALYLSHLQTLIRTSPDINDDERGQLEKSITKLLLRDMGLMMEGYWDSSIDALQQEKEKGAALQSQITSLLANIPQLLWSVDVINNKPIYVSPSSREICDMEIDMPIPCLGWTVPEHRKTVELAWKNALQGRRVEVESRVRQPDGDQRWFRRVFHPFVDENGNVLRIDGVMEDTTELKATLERLHTMAATDSLTGLTNRTLFHDRLEQAIRAGSRDGDRQVVVMLMDLNHFKEINDTLGHAAGDQILIQVSQRLKTALRSTDTLARLGGDEFGILLPNVKDAQKTAERVAKNILKSLVNPFIFGDNELYLGAGIGIAVYPDQGEDVSTLMSRADVAMYGTKTRDNGYLFYDSVLDPGAQQRLQLSGELRHALARDELVLYYQPKVDIHSGRVMGAEALIRWRHPQRGLIPPDQFIPLAERTGQIRPITDWVLKTAAGQCKVWRDAGFNLHAAVNVPARTFQDKTITKKLSDMLNAVNLPPQYLEIEITENVLMADMSHISMMLRDISSLGVTIAIDDFGTGYSSLAYLKKLPLNILKIDKSFVLDMTSDDNDATIVRSTIDLAHNLGLKVVAEGIENQETWDLLAALGCDGAQGFYLSHPLPPEEFSHWLAQSHH